MSPTPTHATVALRTGQASRRGHRVPVCLTTGLARYRDRKQARDAITVLGRADPQLIISAFPCPDCRGHHLEQHTPAARPVPAELAPTPTPAARRPRRYMLIDWENLTHGIRQSRADLHALVRVLTKEAPGIVDADHVVIGASRNVVRSHRWLFDQLPHVRTIIGADAADGADHALLAAVDVHRVARTFDELVIGSGDHAFAPLARRARGLGLTVQIVTTEHPTGRPMLSRDLAVHATTRTRIRLTSRSLQAARADRIRTIAAACASQTPTAGA